MKVTFFARRCFFARGCVLFFVFLQGVVYFFQMGCVLFAIGFLFFFARSCVVLQRVVLFCNGLCFFCKVCFFVFGKGFHFDLHLVLCHFLAMSFYVFTKRCCAFVF